MSLFIKLVPVEQPGVAAIEVEERGDFYVFRLVNIGGTIEVETEHVKLSDALRQVVNRIDIDAQACGTAVKYNVSFE